MKKIIFIFSFFVVAIGSVVSASALPMPDLSNVEAAERVDNNLVFDLTLNSNSDNFGAEDMLKEFFNGERLRFITVNPNLGNGSKEPVFYLYSLNCISPNDFRFTTVDGNSYIERISDTFSISLRTFYSDGSTSYDYWGYPSRWKFSSLILSFPIIDNYPHSDLDFKSCCIEADFDKLIFKTKQYGDLSFTPYLKKEFVPEPPKPPKPVEPPKIPEQSSDYVPFNTSCLLDLFTSIKSTAYSIFFVGFGLFGLFLGFDIIPRTIRKFTKG